MDVELRKLRKKLRAIDRLETHSNLTVDEQNKLALRPQIQARVAEITKETRNQEPQKSLANSTALSNDDFSSDEAELDKKRKSNDSSSERTKFLKLSDRPPLIEEGSNNIDEEITENGVSMGETESINHGSSVEQGTIVTDARSDSNIHQVAQRGDASERVSSSNARPKKNPDCTWKGDVNVAELKKLKWKGRHLDGHNDNVFCIDSNGEYAITGSRDTMVKVWCLKRCEEIRTLLGHSGAVTCVKMLPDSLELRQVLTQLANGETSDTHSERCCLTASTDCCIKLWNYLSGEMLKSIYTFGSVSSLCWITVLPRMISSVNALIISGSDSGKMQIWDIVEGTEMMSHKSHQDTINKIEVSDSVIFTSSKDGLVKIWQLTSDSEGGFSVSPMFVSDCLKRVPLQLGTESAKCSLGDIRAMVVDTDEQLIFVGDDGPNIKIVDWRNGTVQKLKNHDLTFGYTECLQLSAKLLFAAAYDIDTGKGSINVFYRPRKQNLDCLNQLYILTLSFPIDKIPALEAEGYLTTRVLAMNFTQLQNSHWSLVVGGQSLLSFRTDNLIVDHEFEVKSKVYQELSKTSEIDSDHGTSDELFSSDDEFELTLNGRSTRRLSSNGKQLELTKADASYYSYLTSWCNLL